MKNHIGGLDQPHCLHCQQFRIARASANKIHVALFSPSYFPAVLRQLLRLAQSRVANVAVSQLVSSSLRSSPLACVSSTSRRSSPSFASHGPRSCGSCSSISRRMRCAKAGLSPAVEMAICRSPRFTTEPKKKSQFGMSSTLLQGMLRARPRDRLRCSRQRIRCSDHEKIPIEIRCFKPALNPLELPFSCQLNNLGPRLGRNNLQPQPRLEQATDLVECHIARAHQQTVAPLSLRKMGKRLMILFLSLPRRAARGRGKIALDRSEYLSSQLRAQLVVGVAAKPGAKIFFLLAARPGTGAADAQSPQGTSAAGLR